MKFEIYQKWYKRRFSYSFGVQMAEVAVEVETGRVKVLKVTAVNDLGTVIKRQIVEGQIISVPEVEVVSVIRISCF